MKNKCNTKKKKNEPFFPNVLCLVVKKNLTKHNNVFLLHNSNIKKAILNIII